MANQLPQQLAHWYPRRDDHQWVLGTVYKTEGPSYRSPGAMMLFNDLGEQFGLLSGGCLESDIQIKAAQVMVSGMSKTLCYDASDEDDMSFLLGIGCGGTVYILLQLISAENNYLGLPSVFEALQDHQSGFLLQKVSEQPEPAETDFIVEGAGQSARYTELLHNQRAMLVSERDHSWLVTRVSPSFHLLVVGGGVDARPLISIASTLGWETTLCDPRPANGRREHFMNATRILRCHPNALGEETLFDHFDAAVVMTHNLELDAAAISVLQSSSIGYLALLGPIVRRNQVIEMANLSINQLTVSLSGPAGLRLGGELPEEIALSIIAECQAVATGSDAAFISASL